MTLQGTLAALVTPFKDGQVDESALNRLIDFQISEGTDGLVMCGTTGESPTLSRGEQARILEIAVGKTRGRCPVVAGTGTNCTKKTLELSQQAQELGVDALMLVTPYYNKPSQQGLYEHFGYVASRVNLPIILYNIPGRCSREIDQDTIGRLFRDFDNITTVKHATGSVEGAASLRAACEIDILSGDDPITLPLMSVGALGVISVVANILPRQTRAMTDAFLAGDFETAAAVHARLYPLCKALLSLDTNPVPIKTALVLMGLIEEGFRLPMCPMSSDKQERLAELLKTAELIA